MNYYFGLTLILKFLQKHETLRQFFQFKVQLEFLDKVQIRFYECLPKSVSTWRTIQEHCDHCFFKPCSQKHTLFEYSFIILLAKPVRTFNKSQKNLQRIVFQTLQSNENCACQDIAFCFPERQDNCEKLYTDSSSSKLLLHK